MLFLMVFMEFFPAPGVFVEKVRGAVYIPPIDFIHPFSKSVAGF